jgi:uncharacterized protein YaeQ
VSAKYNFSFTSREARRPLPAKLILAQHETETIRHVGLKLLGFLYFARDRLQVEINLDDDNIPFRPDLVQLDYELHPALWVECGECSLAKLDKLAVKVPQAALWVVRASLGEAQALVQAMAREELRRDRYSVLALDHAGFEEVCQHLGPRNEVSWFGLGEADGDTMQFELNGLWYELPYSLLRH